MQLFTGGGRGQEPPGHRLTDPLNCTEFHLIQGDIENMSGEMLNATFLSFTLILVGLALGFALLKLQGGEE